MGTFIQITFDNQAFSPEIRAELVAACPVDIFTLQDDTLHIDPDQEDECTLCNLCLKIAPAGALRIAKTYKDETLVSSGGS